MKKFFVALAILFCVAGNVDAAQFTAEQKTQMASITVQPSAAALTVDVAAFRNNFNGFMSSFIAQTNAGENAAKFEQIFLIDEQSIVTNGQNVLFVKNFMDMVAIVGSVDENGRFKTLNLFGAAIDDKNEAMIHGLVLDAFVKGISPDLNAQALLNEANKNSDGTFVKGNLKFSFATVDNLDVVSVTAN